MCRKIFGCHFFVICFVMASVFLSVQQKLNGADEVVTASSRSSLGVNLSGIQSYTTAFPFLDVFKSSSSWVSGHGDVWDDGRRINVDEAGWVRSLAPGQVVHSVFIASGIRVPAGQYVVEYEGEGEIVYQEGARLVEHAQGRDVIEVDPEHGNCYLDIISLNPQNYLRNIGIRLPVQAPAGETFNPVFLERIANFKTLRFMCWMLGDNPEQVGQQTWGERPKLGDARWSERGVPLEVMIDLSNRIGADPWISLPHQADDDYIRHFVELVRDKLDPKLKIYVEHSNEVWNSTFSSYAYASERGIALGLSTDPYEARWRYHVRRSREIFAIFEELLGRSRIVRVLAAQQDGPFEAEQMLAYEETPKHIDALAIGAYFGVELGLPESQSRMQQMTVDDLFHELETVTLPRAMQYVSENAAIAARYQVPLVAYEGGQHLSSIMSGIDDPAINELFDAANRDPRMGRLYSRLLEEWNTVSGGGLFLHLNECDRMGPYGRWGLLESIDQPRSEAPKYDAVMRWIEDGAGRSSEAWRRKSSERK